MKISIDALASAAGLTPSGYKNWLAGRRTPRPGTVGKLNMALRRFGIGFASEAGALAPHAAYKACVALAAFHLAVDARAALTSQPGKRATFSPAWMEQAAARRIGLTIASQFFGLGVSDLARAAHMTKQGVSAALRAIEWERDPEGGNNRDLDRLLNDLEQVFAP